LHGNYHAVVIPPLLSQTYCNNRVITDVLRGNYRTVSCFIYI